MKLSQNLRRIRGESSPLGVGARRRRARTRIKVGLIGCGTIGSELAFFISRNFSAQTVPGTAGTAELSRNVPGAVIVAYLCDLHLEKAERLHQKLVTSSPYSSPPARGRGRVRGKISSPKIVSLPVLIRRSDLIIEAASAEISGKVAEDALRLGKKVLIMSVGGLIQDSRWRRYLPVGADLRVRPQRDKANGPTHGSAPTIYIPSGAIAGIDALLAASEGRVRKVRLITRKPPKSLKEAPYFKHHAFPRLRSREEKLVFKGSALQAVKAFPANINVSAVLSLAGVGPKKTQVEIWTSKAYRWNEHEVRIESDAGVVRTATRNVPSKENPKTSRLAILSAKATLRKIFSSLKIGT